MIKKALFTAAAVAGLLSASVSAQAGTCPITGATSDSGAKACEEGKKEKCEDKNAKEGAKASEGSKDKTGCADGSCKGKK
jgi:hypothetical protein